MGQEILWSMNQSLKPKASFQKTPFAKSLEALVLDEGFRNACQQSLCQVIEEIASTDDPVQAAANWHRIEGARKAIDTLLNLSEIPKPPEKRNDYNLKT